jgi:3-methyladenine DNA glycosylase AlkD
MNVFQDISGILRRLADPQIAEHSQRFFKTGKGQYGEGDLFLGIRVPVLREQARKFKDAPLDDVQRLLKSDYHEERLCALLLLVQKFSKAGTREKKALYDFYLRNTRYINNWDLVDLSAYWIVGAYLADKNKRQLYTLARSKSLWERRIAMISTFHFIKNNQFEDTLALAKSVISDREDLMHKATGWMLREVGKRDAAVLKSFLHAHYLRMPRTMLRYAIEKLPQQERLQYLKGQVAA